MFSKKRFAQSKTLRFAQSKSGSEGQALIEYLLMTLMLLALFTGLYKVLSEQLKNYFTQAGKVILSAYY